MDILDYGLWIYSHDYDIYDETTSHRALPPDSKITLIEIPHHTFTLMLKGEKLISFERFTDDPVDTFNVKFVDPTFNSLNRTFAFRNKTNLNQRFFKVVKHAIKRYKTALADSKAAPKSKYLPKLDALFEEICS